jgi:hypothetical protein
MRLSAAVAPFANHFLSMHAKCQPGEHATGGGYVFSGTDQPDDVVNLNNPSAWAVPNAEGLVPTEWAVQIYDMNGDDGASPRLTASGNASCAASTYRSVIDAFAWPARD